MVTALRSMLLLLYLIPFASQAAITADISVASDHAWQRQEVIVTAEIHSADKYATLNWPVQNTNRYEAYLHPVETLTSGQQDKVMYRRILRLSLFIYATGKQTLHLPNIEYVRGGRVQESVTIPTVSIRITPLPVYVPPDMPVGEVTLTNSQITHESLLLWPDRLNEWQLTFQGTGVAAQWLPRVLRQVTGNTSAEVFKASSVLTTSVQNHQFVSEKTYRIPFAALHNGLLRLPELSWQYFDPASGTIVDKKYKPAPLLVTGWSILIPSLTLGLILAGWLIVHVSTYARRQWHRFHHRQLALKQLRNADKPDEIRQAMRLFARAHHWPENISLFEWRSYYASIRPISATLDSSIQQLDAMFYAGKPAEDSQYSELRKSLIKAF